MNRRSLTTFGILLLIAIGFHIAVFIHTKAIGGFNPHLFLSPNNISNILGQASIVGILACGMTLVIITARIDLSVGSMMGMLAAINAILLSSDRGFHLAWPAGAGILATLLLGALIGGFQGGLVAFLNVPAFVVTLGGLMAFRGVLILLANQSITIQSPLIQTLGGDSWNLGGFGLPIRCIILIAVAILFHIIATRIRFGRYIFAIGGNETAARYSGISVKWHLVGVFALMGICAAIGGILNSGRLMAAGADAGDLMELYAIAACVIGGTSLSGGRGSIIGSILGALIMSTLRNGLSLLNAPSAVEKIVLGTILIFAVALDLAVSRNRHDK